MTYAREAVASQRAVIAAVAEPRRERREDAAREFGIKADACFDSWTDLAAARPDVDAVIVATQDALHTAPAVAFADLGYHLLLEKPMAPTEQECREIVEAVERAGVVLMVCHVLRYTEYTRRLEDLIGSGRIGDIVSVQHLEPVGWWHQAHSYVRGNWRREDQSSSMLMSKSCHDIDWLGHVIDRPVRRVSSFGGLYEFHPARKPAGAGSNCLECPVESGCPFSARKVYLDHVDDPDWRQWPLAVLTRDVSHAGIEAALRDGPYGRCVYDCDNDVVDHQVVNLEYEGGVTASFTMTAFTRLDFRKTRIFGTRGSIEGDGRTLTVVDFLDGSEETFEVVPPDGASAAEGHGGGDRGLVLAFLDAVDHGDPAAVPTGAHASLRSHQAVWAAERARRTGSVVDLTPSPTRLAN
jgi:predicted dehydrogenase